MKKTILLLFILISNAYLFAQDTISVELGTKARIVIYTKDAEGLRMVKKMDLNKLIREVTGDSTASVAQTKTYEYEFNTETKALDIKTEIRGNDTIRRYSYEQKEYTPNIRIGRSLDLNFCADIGIVANYLENGKTPDANAVGYGLSSKANYFALYSMLQYRIGKSKSPLFLNTGIGVSWYNFVFPDNTYISANSEGVEFRNYETDFQQNLRKSKLTITYLMIPLNLQLRFRNKRNKETFSFSAGGYAGVRVDSYAKRKIGNDPNRDRNTFYLNQWRYGLETSIGFRGVTFFGKYDLNELFIEDNGPKLNAFAIGIRILE